MTNCELPPTDAEQAIRLTQMAKAAG